MEETNMMQLPQEVLEKVLRFCNKKSLVNLAATSKILNTRVRPVLFRHISIKSLKNARLLLSLKDDLKLTKSLLFNITKIGEGDGLRIVAMTCVLIINATNPVMMKNLSITGNAIVGSDVLLLAYRLVNLTSIVLKSCKDVSSYVFIGLSKFEFLQKLVVDDCHIPGSDFRCLHGLADLKILRCTGLCLTIFDDISQIVDLKSLTFGQNTDVEDSIFSVELDKLKGLRRLETLCIHNSNIKPDEDKSLDLVENHPSLRNLVVACCILDTAILESIYSSKSLTSLAVAESNITSSQLRLMKSLKKLKNLNLPMSNLNDIGMELIGKLVSLTHLNISHNMDISDEGIKQLSPLVSLHWISITGCVGLTDTSLMYLSALPSLKYVTDGSGTKFSEMGLNQMSLIKGWIVYHE